MSRLRLTERAVAKLRAPDPSGKQAIHWDDELRGFGVLCSGVTTSKTYIAQRDLPSGKSRRVTVAAVSEVSLADARKAAADLLVDMRRGIDPKAGRKASVTLGEVLEAYLVARKDLRERSVLFYRNTLQKHLRDWLDLPIRDITPEMVEKRHARIGGSVGNGAMRIVRLLWNFQSDRNPELPPNPVRRLRRQWFAEPRRTRMVRTDEMPKFYQALTRLPNPVHRDYLILLLFTGLRRTEAATLTWADVDFGAKVIRVPAKSTKAGRKLDLPMTDVVRDMLVGRRSLGGGPSDYVFVSNSKSGHIEEPRFPLKLIAAATGIKISVHDLRRGYITAAESADISPLALKALVNHSLGNDVTSGYVQMTAERLREPAQRVADKIKQMCGIAEPAENVRRIR
jgi:integrase